jgi:hypothetical protein
MPFVDNADLVSRLLRAEQKIEQLTQILDDIVAKNLPIDLVLTERSDHDRAQVAPYVIEFDGEFDHANFYKPEIYENKKFRWMGPYAESHLLIYRSRKVAYQLMIDAPFNMHGEEFLKNMTLLVDGRPVSWTREANGSGSIISATIPAVADATAMPAFLLGIVFPNAIKFSGGDDRSGTIALSKLTITPAA